MLQIYYLIILIYVCISIFFGFMVINRFEHKFILIRISTYNLIISIIFMFINIFISDYYNNINNNQIKLLNKQWRQIEIHQLTHPRVIEREIYLPKTSLPRFS